MHAHPAARDDAHLKARLALLEKEKDLNRRRDALSAERRALPPVPVTKRYTFETGAGAWTLADLFGPHSQLLVYHFMFPPEWERGCRSCSLVMDGIDRVLPHLAAAATALVAVARAPWPRLEAFRKRLGWETPFASSGGTDFNADFGVTLPADGLAEAVYNYRPGGAPGPEMPGLSSFTKGADGQVMYRYSTYARGLDPALPVFQLLDLAAEGRNEAAGIMSWVRLRDEYGAEMQQAAG